MFVARALARTRDRRCTLGTSRPEPKTYALNRYDFEAHWHWGIIEQRLANRAYLLGHDYSIVDTWPLGWARMMPFVLGADDTWTVTPLQAAARRGLGPPCGERVEALRNAQLQNRNGRSSQGGHVPLQRTPQKRHVSAQPRPSAPGPAFTVAAHTGHTSGLADEHVQGNVVILPASWANDFCVLPAQPQTLPGAGRK